MRKTSLGARDLRFLIVQSNHLFFLYIKIILATYLVVILLWLRGVYGVTCYNNKINQLREY